MEKGEGKDSAAPDNPKNLAVDVEVDVPTVLVTPETDPSLLRQNSLGSTLARRRCVVRLDGHRYTIGWTSLFSPPFLPPPSIQPPSYFPI